MGHSRTQNVSQSQHSCEALAHLTRVGVQHAVRYAQKEASIAGVHNELAEAVQQQDQAGRISTTWT